jgi:hypothetical protein
MLGTATVLHCESQLVMMDLAEKSCFVVEVNDKNQAVFYLVKKGSGLS